MTTSENGYSFNNAGFVFGADYRITPQLIAGMAFGYTQSNTNFDTSASGQSLNGNLLQGNLYTTYFPTDAFYLNGDCHNWRRRQHFSTAYRHTQHAR